MKKLLTLILIFTMILASCGSNGNNSEITGGESGTTSLESSGSAELSEIKISEDEIYDKIYGSWLGQAAGVVWGWPTEFQYAGQIMPESAVPDFSSLDMNHVYGEDDLYVEIPFLEAMKKHGVDCSLDALAGEFKNTAFPLDHANKIGRENLQKGISAPDSGSYKYNFHCDDLDWQIEADFVGCIYPGLVNEAAERSFEIGHIMNYGDGVYGGVFVAAMHSAAFTAKSISEIIDAGISVIPEGTKFRDMMEDVTGWHEEGLTWQENWQKTQDKWDSTARCLWYSGSAANIDAKMNSAYILIGLLYGEGDFEESMRISMMCGQDSDCNPSSVGAILGNYYGYKAIESKWKNFDQTGLKFSYTEYSFKEAVDLNYQLALELLESKGFTSEDSVWTIKYKPEYKTVEFEQWPDMPTAEITVKADGTDTVRMAVRAHDISGIAKIEWDMGDGIKFGDNISGYRYKEKGTYIVKCTITSNSGGKAEYEETVEITSITEPYDDPGAGSYRNIAKSGIIICTVYEPTGGGSKDPETIRDGIKTGGNTDQYDTYAGYLSEHTDHIGYMFYEAFKINKVEFTEGIHYDNGGWFVGGTLKLEALIGGEWKEIEASISPEYPAGTTMGDYGTNFESYTFEFNNTECEGIRLSGTAGGEAGFIGCAELEVYGVEAAGS